MRVKDAVGRFGEDVVAARLATAGWRVVERNWRCRDGELDLVARDGDVLVFCEVKTRSGAGFGTPSEAVTPAKLRRIRRLAARWIMERAPAFPEVRWREIRFDVIGVLRTEAGVQVEHLRGVM